MRRAAIVGEARARIPATVPAPVHGGRKQSPQHLDRNEGKVRHLEMVPATMALSPVQPTGDITDGVEIVLTNDLDSTLDVAYFLRDYFFDANLNPVQKFGVRVLWQDDATAKLVSGNPFTMIVARKGDVILSVAWIECWVLDKRLAKIRGFEDNENVNTFSDGSGDNEIIAYMSNMAVRPDVRRTGLGRLMLRAAERQAKDRGYRHLYLIVDSKNLPARKLYETSGYELFYEDDQDTIIVPDWLYLKREEIVALAMRKDVSEVDYEKV